MSVLTRGQGMHKRFTLFDHVTFVRRYVMEINFHIIHKRRPRVLQTPPQSVKPSTKVNDLTFTTR